MATYDELVAQMAKCQEQMQIFLSASTQSSSSTSSESLASSSEPSSSALPGGAVPSPISQPSLSSVSSSEPSPSSSRCPSLPPTPQAQSSMSRSEPSQSLPAQDANPMVSAVKSEPNDDRDIIWVAPPGHAPIPLMTETEMAEKELAEMRETARLAKIKEEIAKLKLEAEESKKKTREHEKQRLEVEAENEKEAKKAAAAPGPPSQVKMERINRQPSIPVPQVPPKQEPHPKDQSDHRPQAKPFHHHDSYKLHRNKHDLHLPADERGQRSVEVSTPAVVQPEPMLDEPAEDEFEPDQPDYHQPEPEDTVEEDHWFLRPSDSWPHEENLEDEPGPAPRAVEYMGFVNDIGRPEVRNYKEMFGTEAQEPINFEEYEDEVVMEDVEVNPPTGSLQEPEGPMDQDPLDATRNYENEEEEDVVQVIRDVDGSHKKLEEPLDQLDMIKNHEIRAGNRIARGGAAVRTRFGMMRRGFRIRDGTASRPGRGSRGGNGLTSNVEAQEAVSNRARGAPRAPRASRVPRAPRGRRGARGARVSTSTRAEGADNAPMLQEEAEQVEDLQQVVGDEGEKSEDPSVTPSGTGKSRKRPLPKTTEKEEAKKKKTSEERASRAAARNESKGDKVRNIQYVRKRQ